MSNISNLDDSSEKELNNHPQVENETEILGPDVPKSKLTEVFQQVEMMALSKSNKNSLDFSTMNEGQIDKLIDLMGQNENNAFQFHTKKLEIQKQKLDTLKEIKLSEHKNSVISEKTVRYNAIFIIAGIILISLVILIFKDTYFDKWLTFITGIGAGFGLSKINKTQKTETPIRELEKKTSKDEEEI